MRRAAAIAAVLVLAGCGASHHRAAAPPIRAVGTAPDPELQRELEQLFAPQTSSHTVTLTFDSAGSAKPTPAQLAHLQAEIAARRAAERPAPGSQPRVVARLPLAGGGKATLVAWWNARGALCTFTQVSDADGSGGGGGPAGPCVPAAGPLAPHCAALCLASNGEGQPLRWVLSGTVAAGADSVAVTTADGRTGRYRLTGPRLPGGRRVFLLDLGPTDWRTLTLYRGGAVVDRTALPHAIVVVERCQAEVRTPSSAALNACLKAHGRG